jgi:hypothetical protein
MCAVRSIESGQVLSGVQIGPDPKVARLFRTDPNGKLLKRTPAPFGVPLNQQPRGGSKQRESEQQPVMQRWRWRQIHVQQPFQSLVDCTGVAEHQQRYPQQACGAYEQLSRHGAADGFEVFLVESRDLRTPRVSVRLIAAVAVRLPYDRPVRFPPMPSSQPATTAQRSGDAPKAV